MYRYNMQIEDLLVSEVKTQLDLTDEELEELVNFVNWGLIHLPTYKRYFWFHTYLFIAGFKMNKLIRQHMFVNNNHTQ